MTETIFDKIISKEIPADIVYEDNNFLAFNDINPQAPIHILVIPKKKIPSINNLELSDSNLVGEMVIIANKIAKEKGIDETSRCYETICNYIQSELRW